MSNKPFTTVFVESVIVGLLLIPFAYLAGYFAKAVTSKPALPDICSKWNKYYIMEINLFLTGFIFHMVFEYFGLNRAYAKNYP